MSNDNAPTIYGIGGARTWSPEAARREWADGQPFAVDVTSVPAPRRGTLQSAMQQTLRADRRPVTRTYQTADGGRIMVVAPTTDVLDEYVTAWGGLTPVRRMADR